MSISADEKVFVSVRTQECLPFTISEWEKSRDEIKNEIGQITISIACVHDSFLGQVFVSRKKRRLKQLHRRLAKLNSILQCTTGRMKRKRAMYEAESAKSREQFRAICTIPSVERIWMEGTVLHMCTSTQYGKSEKNMWHRIGRFNISFCLHDVFKSVRWKNLDGTRIVSGTILMAPNNVNKNGSISCFGDAAVPIRTAFNERDFYTIASILVRFVECGGRNNERLRYWPRVPLEEVPRWYIDTFGE